MAEGFTGEGFIKERWPQLSTEQATEVAAILTSGFSPESLMKEVARRSENEGRFYWADLGGTKLPDGTRTPDKLTPKGEKMREMLGVLQGSEVFMDAVLEETDSLAREKNLGLASYPSLVEGALRIGLFELLTAFKDSTGKFMDKAKAESQKEGPLGTFSLIGATLKDLNDASKDNASRCFGIPFGNVTHAGVAEIARRRQEAGETNAVTPSNVAEDLQLATIKGIFD